MVRKIAGLLMILFAVCLAAGCSGETTEPSTKELRTIAPDERDSRIPTLPDPTVPSEEETVPVPDLPEGNNGEDDGPHVTPSIENPPSENVGKTALAVVPNYVNVRTGPSTEYDIVGKIFNYCAAQILDEVDGEDGTWFYMTSGTVKGYVKSEFFLVGQEAEDMKSEVGVLKGRVIVDYLRVRSAPDLSDANNVFTYFERDTVITIEKLTDDGWAKVEMDDSDIGYVYADCLEIRREFLTAISLEEEAEQLAKKEAASKEAAKAKAAYEAQQAAIRAAAEAAERARREAEEAAARAAAAEAAERAAAEKAAAEAARAAALAAEAEANARQDALLALRNAVVAYALQFVGNPYVHAGRSLITGTDCSGFTKLIYYHFGYTDLAYTPAGQAAQYVRIDDTSEANLLPGDLLFYSNSTKYLGHVAIYIGDGRIVHAANVEYGVVIWSAYYRNPLFAVRVIN